MHDMGLLELGCLSSDCACPWPNMVELGQPSFSVGDPDLLAILYRVQSYCTLQLLALLYCISLRLDHYTAVYTVSGET